MVEMARIAKMIAKENYLTMPPFNHFLVI